MTIHDRAERQQLRQIQAHLRASAAAAGAVFESIGTVDVCIHLTSQSPRLNGIMPHKGVAWVRREDLQAACLGLERLGRVPRLIIQDALFPQAFAQQLHLMGLELETSQALYLYAPLYGPELPGEVLRGRLPPAFAPDVTARLATDTPDLTVWLHLFQSSGESVPLAPDTVRALADAATRGEKLFTVAYYDRMPLGIARAGLYGSSAELEVLRTAPHWQNLGLEEALITTTIRAAQAHGAGLIFTTGPAAYERLYRRLGFVRHGALQFYTQYPPDEPAHKPEERE